MIFNLTPLNTMNWLHNSLVIEKKTLREFDIIQAWRAKQWLPDNCIRTELLLFRTHFYIFHQLYVLKKQLITHYQGDINIHTLGSYYMDKPVNDQEKNKLDKNKDTQLHQHDGLLHYYLDWKPLFETDAAEIGRLKQFIGSGISQPYALKNAFERFQLTPPTNELAIKKAYRKLAIKHHPDKGGRIQDIQRINEEKSLLIRWLQHQKI
jgi:hypothetical protein